MEAFGDASADKAIGKSFDDDFKRAEFTSLPLTLVILVIAFGALVAAGVPLLLAVSGVIATIGLLAPISQIAPVDQIDQLGDTADSCSRPRSCCYS